MPANAGTIAGKLNGVGSESDQGKRNSVVLLAGGDSLYRPWAAYVSSKKDVSKHHDKSCEAQAGRETECLACHYTDGGDA